MELGPQAHDSLNNDEPLQKVTSIRYLVSEGGAQRDDSEWMKITWAKWRKFSGIMCAYCRYIRLRIYCIPLLVSTKKIVITAHYFINCILNHSIKRQSSCKCVQHLCSNTFYYKKSVVKFVIGTMFRVSCVLRKNGCVEKNVRILWRPLAE